MPCLRNPGSRLELLTLQKPRTGRAMARIHASQARGAPLGGRAAGVRLRARPSSQVGRHDPPPRPMREALSWEAELPCAHPSSRVSPNVHYSFCPAHGDSQCHLSVALQVVADVCMFGVCARVVAQSGSVAHRDLFDCPYKCTHRACSHLTYPDILNRCMCMETCTQRSKLSQGSE